MLAVNSLAWLWCITGTAISAATIYRRRKESRTDPAENNSQFRELQRQFLFPYLAVLLAESLQAPYLYALLHSYHFVPSQIAALYVIGILANVVFSFYCVHLSARYGRRSLCLLSLAVGSLACSLKFFSSFLPLLLGRILDGIFAALVTVPFQQWYSHEHLVNFDFPTEWISSTFTFVSLGSGFLAVVAGLLSQAVVSISRETALPFFFSIVALVIGGCFIGTKWPENKPIDAPLPFRSVISKAISILRTSPLCLVLCLVACCLETSVQIFVFLWAPIFIKSNKIEHHELSLGVIYGALVCSYLAGIVFFSSNFARRISNSKLLIGSAALAFVALFASYSDFPSISINWPKARFDRIFLSFVIFELAIGVYNPAMDALQASLLPAQQRSALLALVRLPVSALSSFAILFLFPNGGGEHTMMTLTIGLLGLGTTLGLILDVALSHRQRHLPNNDPDHIYFPPQQPPESV